MTTWQFILSVIDLVVLPFAVAFIKMAFSASVKSSATFHIAQRFMILIAIGLIDMILIAILIANGPPHIRTPGFCDHVTNMKCKHCNNVSTMNQKVHICVLFS